MAIPVNMLLGSGFQSFMIFASNLNALFNQETLVIFMTKPKLPSTPSSESSFTAKKLQEALYFTSPDLGQVTDKT